MDCLVETKPLLLEVDTDLLLENIDAFPWLPSHYRFEANNSRSDSTDIATAMALYKVSQQRGITSILIPPNRPKINLLTNSHWSYNTAY